MSQTAVRSDQPSKIGSQTLSLPLLTRLEFGDLLLFFYLLIFIRPWFWSLGNTTAWAVTILISLAAWYVYVITKEPVESRPGISFWLIVGVPLLVAYILRAPFPDASFDVWSLRLFHGERGLTGFIYRPGEFFPTSAPFNPAPDMLTGIFRHALGYRVGTILNLLVLLWTGTVLDKLLRPYVQRAWLRAVSILLVVWVEHILFEINNYMVDLLALPLMLEATRLVVDSEVWKRSRHVLVRVAFLLAASVTLKLSNGALALPLAALALWREFRLRPLAPKRVLTNLLGSIGVGLALLAPFMFWVWRLTGSPLFPIYNGYFNSPLYPPSNGWDGRWGGFQAKEILAWPVLMFFAPQRAAELGVYTGRLSIAFLAAIACLFLWRWMAPRVRIISIVLIIGTLLWSLTMGYIRYGLYLELLSGLFLIMLATILLQRRQQKALYALGLVMCGLLFVQSGFATRYVLQQEWSMRPTVFQQPGYFNDESKYLFRDRSIRQWLPAEDRARFDIVEVWIVSGSKTAGLLPFLNDKAPVIGIRSAGIFTMDASRRELNRVLDLYQGKKVYSIALPEDYEDSVKALRNVGLNVGEPEKLTIPFFAPSHQLAVYLFRVNR